MTAIVYAKYYGTDKLVVQLEDGTQYQASEFLEKTKNVIKWLIEKCRVDSSKRKFVVCKTVQEGEWSGLEVYSQTQNKVQ